MKVGWAGGEKEEAAGGREPPAIMLAKGLPCSCSRSSLGAAAAPPPPTPNRSRMFGVSSAPESAEAANGLEVGAFSLGKKK